MRREENAVFVRQLLLVHRQSLEVTLLLEHLCWTVHVYVLVWAGSGVVKAGQEAGLVAHDCDPISVEERAGHVGPGDEGSYLERVVGAVLVQLRLEVVIVEVAIVGHRYQNDVGTSFPPWYQVCIVLEDGKEDHRFLGIHLVIVLELLEVESVNLGLGVLFICSKSRQNDLAKFAVIRMPAILLTEIDLFDVVVQFVRAHLLALFLLLLGLDDLLRDLFDPQFVDQQISGVRGATASEDAHVALIRATHPLHNGSCLLPRPRTLLPGAGLQRVRIGIQRHNLFLYVLLDEPETLATGRVVRVNQRLLPIGRLHHGVIIGTNHIVPDIVQELVLVLREQVSLMLLAPERLLGRHTGAHDHLLVVCTELLLLLGRKLNLIAAVLNFRVHLLLVFGSTNLF